MEDDIYDREIFDILDSLVEEELANIVFVDEEEYYTISPEGIEVLKEAGYLHDIPGKKLN
jgi:DNA-binding PadR family transcriptional regulator